MYVFVRKDLPLPAQAVQAAHAASEFARLHPLPPDLTPTIVLLEVPDEDSLKEVETHSRDRPTFMFREPDMQWAPTAIAAGYYRRNNSPFKQFKLWKGA